tara:strand:- start:17 stop:844 length:828 start_codon:yes stop_codon:yes gene_type:complete
VNKTHKHVVAGKPSQYEVVVNANANGRVVTTQNPLPVTNITDVPLAAGLLEGYSAVHKFGTVEGTEGNGWNTIWTGAEQGIALYPWPVIADASVVSVVSTSGLDITDVTIQGLDASYNFQEETITLTGATPAVGTKTWHRVNRAFMAGTDINVGRIDIKNTLGTVVSTIKIARGQTLQSFYTIPAGYTGFLKSLQMVSSKPQTVEVMLFARPFGGAFRATGGTFLYRMDHTIEYASPVVFTEKTDMDMRVIGSANDDVSSSFDLTIVSNTVLYGS